jgi:hypothetical protein
MYSNEPPLGAVGFVVNRYIWEITTMVNDSKWSKTEKQIAKKAFEKAYKGECADLAGRIRSKAEEIKEPADIWRLQDFLNKKAKEIENKYDYRYSVLILVFAKLIKDGWLKVEDLKGLGQEKIDRITAILNL